MELITRNLLASQAAEKWHRQYHGSTKDIYEKLKALGPNPSPEDVNRVIGNGMWTRCHNCSECKAETTMVVLVGEEPDYESETAWLCGECLKKALALISSG